MKGNLVLQQNSRVLCDLWASGVILAKGALRFTAQEEDIFSFQAGNPQLFCADFLESAKRRPRPCLQTPTCEGRSPTLPVTAEGQAQVSSQLLSALRPSSPPEWLSINPRPTTYLL